MELRIGVLVVLSILCFPRSGWAQYRTVCEPVNEEVRLRVVHSIERLFHTEPIVPVIEEERFVTGTCFWQIAVSVPNSDKRWVLYLSPDRHFLSGTLLDISVDPVAADRGLADRLSRDAQQDRPPMRGPDVAPVTLVVFSDFQCSHCAVFAQILERYRKANPDRVRTIFRNLPLNIHDWAAEAARAGACVARQDNLAFWKFHDDLLAEQKETSIENLNARISKLLARIPEVHVDAYGQCMNSRYPQEIIDRDISQARSLNLDAAPSIFVNGRKYTGFRDDAAFAFAINLATPPEQGIKSSAHGPHD